MCVISISLAKRRDLFEQLKSANHQNTPTQNMKGREDNTDDRRQGLHKRQVQIWTDKQKCLYSTSHTGRHLKMPH